MINAPNIYNEKAFKLGREAFLEDNGMIVNPYDKETGDYYDWRIGYGIAKMEFEIEQRKKND